MQADTFRSRAATASRQFKVCLQTTGYALEKRLAKHQTYVLDQRKQFPPNGFSQPLQYTPNNHIVPQTTLVMPNGGDE